MHQKSFADALEAVGKLFQILFGAGSSPIERVAIILAIGAVSALVLALLLMIKT